MFQLYETDLCPNFQILCQCVSFLAWTSTESFWARMAEWHVSESESEGEGAGDGGVELGSLRIPPHRVAELLKTIEERKTLDLDCLAGAVAGLSSEGRRRERRRKHKRAKRKSEASGSAGDSKNQEEVSETASELRSTASTDTTTREGKW